MATTPAQKRTPRRRASASTVPAVDVAVSDAASEVSATENAGPAAAAKPARKTATKTATKTAASKAARPAAKTRKAAAEPGTEAAGAADAPATQAPVDASKPGRKKAAKPAVEAANKAANKAASVDMADAAVEAPADAVAKTQPAPAAPVKKPAAGKTAAAKTAAKAAPAKKTKAPARKAVAAPDDRVDADAPAVGATQAEAAPAPARKRGARKPAAEATVIEATLESPAAAPADGEPLAAQARNESQVTATEVETAATAAEAGDLTEAGEAAEAATAADAEAPDDSGGDGPAGSEGRPEAAAAPERSRRNRRRGRDRDRKRDHGARQPDAAAPSSADAVAETGEATASTDTGAMADIPADAASSAAPEVQAERQALKAAPAAPAAPARPPRPAPSGPAHSTLRCVDGDQRLIVWHTGHGASDALFYAALERLGAEGQLRDDDDDSLPRLLRQAGDEGHRVEVEPAVWAQLAARRDARTRAGVLMAAYPDGPASAALARLLTVPLPLYQAEGALWAVVAGRGLLADERGLGKSVQAIAAAQLWRRHFGVRRIAVISGAGERLAWQRAWRRFAGVEAQVMEGGLHQRQAFWSQDSEVRILAPEALNSDAAHLAHWAPELVIVDEPQRLALDGDAWAALDQAPQALVLCGAALDDQPSLLQSLVAWLDRDRLGALAALREVQAAREGRAVLDEAGVERVSDALSRSVLQRQRAEVADQLPPLVYSERIVPLAPAQREAHDRLLATLRRNLGGWLASGYLSDTDQWRLATTLRAALAACHRADPAVADSPLAEGLVQAAADQLSAWAPNADGAASPQVLLLCDTEADLAQLGAALAARGLLRDGLQLALAGQPVTLAAEAVLQVGVPWRTRRAALLPAGTAADTQPGQQWLLLVAQDSLEAALFDTLASRTDAPRSAADPGGRGFLQGERLLAWLQAIRAALQAMPAAAPSVGQTG